MTQQPPHPVPSSTARDDRLRVMVVDDDDAFRSFFLRVAGRAGWVALAVDSPDRALAALSSFVPHLIFLDLSFPDMDGLAVLSELAPRCADAAVTLTSSCDPEVLRSAHRVGGRLGVRMLTPLPKPVTMDDLTQALRAFESEGPALTPTAVREALDDGLINLVYQPKICLKSMAYRGVEALARWSANGTAIPPGQFVPVVERDESLSLQLLTHVVARAVSQASSWRGAGARCAVNMSALCLADERLPQRLTDTLRGTGLSPHDFVLELTETASLQNPDRVERILTGLRIRGFTVSLDDFGTGHSSLMHLQRMPVNEIKIDQTFVATLEDDPRSDQIVRLMVTLGQTLNATTVAEGIETEAQAEILRGMSCDEGQGYYFARPMDAEHLETWRGMWANKQPKDPPTAED
ncbi:EAL domain-containing response regulator [Roseospira visakhapatnamensis]|uniref:EAL domain-containing protein (Putative c-di-GMP-specific phosphodiesterase class I)/ActR/RegA family two-component response regulator n=1 Tax=Roseospira visakhapatnamensis TaxID=390880 RepID=A0A7W6RCD3_9PROT|nr:EAL domain-containing response regulator [Roseospira visakhapatnamensis]MBB4265838.1 EAL domain-containing protein (putative c-di-GMP-specific phosphodiesterase class I)/ActR/RegA family two-component response regulator [Roseospira visakhapatnamensis]